MSPNPMSANPNVNMMPNPNNGMMSNHNSGGKGFNGGRHPQAQHQMSGTSYGQPPQPGNYNTMPNGAPLPRAHFGSASMNNTSVYGQKFDQPQLQLPTQAEINRYALN